MGAKVTLKNTATNEARAISSDEAGNYTFPALLPGRYSVHVEHPGFKMQLISGIERR